MVGNSKMEPDERSPSGESSGNGVNPDGRELVETSSSLKHECSGRPDSNVNGTLGDQGTSTPDSVDDNANNELSENRCGSNKEQKIQNFKPTTESSISLGETFDCKRQDVSGIIKNCTVNCSLTEEEVENKRKRKMLPSSEPVDTETAAIFKSSKIIIDSDQNENIFSAGDANCQVIDKNENTLNNSGVNSPSNKYNDDTTNKMFCSTPLNKVGVAQQNICENIDFEKMSPLEQPLVKSRNLKRKNLRLTSIKEEDEDLPESSSEKKLKIDGDENEIGTIDFKNDVDFLSMSQFEAPAKSILKKWQPSYVSRNSGTSGFITVDETAGNEEDDFEIACKSLTEELMKSTSNMEKETQIDDDKFEEIWRELNQELDGKTSLSIKSMEESTVSESNITVLSSRPMDISDPSHVDSDNDDTLKNEKSSSSQLDSTVVTKELSIDGKVLQPRENTICEKTDKERSVSLIAKLKQNSNSDSSESNENTAPENASKSSNRFDDKKDAEMDEEDELLEGDKICKGKPYHFVEYISQDPQENEDNYNPEWKKLGMLTNDEERYKAVRDRWRSLIPPDPNKDLTCRQWREKNKLPPIVQTTVNNNHCLFEDNERTQPCTAVFDMKIDGIVEELENTRREILKQRNFEFEQLAKQQDQEQRRCCLSGGSNMAFAFLNRKQLEQCRELKQAHDNNIKEITYLAEEKIKLLKDARDEVLLFQKFYKGVGNVDHDDEILYMTNTQIQELVETEAMLEKYESFYRG